MPSIQQSLKSNIDTTQLRDAEQEGLSQSKYVAGAPSVSSASPLLRCPVPVIRVPSTDDLQQWNRAGQVPAYRIFPT